MDSFLAAIKRHGGKPLSSSCGDLSAIANSGQYDEPDFHLLKKDSNDTPGLFSRFLRPRSQSPEPRPERGSESLDRAKSRSSSELLNTFDCQLAEIRAKLAMFREQDTDFRERMDSLSNSIGELASNCSLAPSDNISVASADLMIDEEQNYKDDDHSIEGELQNNTVSASFSTEMLNQCIPTIEVTHYKRRLSDSTLHGSILRPLKSSSTPDRHSICCLTDHSYFNSNGEQLSTLL